MCSSIGIGGNAFKFLACLSVVVSVFSLCSDPVTFSTKPSRLNARRELFSGTCRDKSAVVFFKEFCEGNSKLVIAGDTVISVMGCCRKNARTSFDTVVTCSGIVNSLGMLSAAKTSSLVNATMVMLHAF